MMIRTWDVPTGELRQVLEGHTDRVRSVAFSPDGKALVSVGHDRSLKLWDLTATNEPDGVPVRNLNRRPVHFFERLTPPRNQLKSSEAGHTAPLAGVAFSANGRTIVTGGDDLAVVAWDVTGIIENESIDAHEGSVNAVDYSRDGQLLVSASNDRSVRLWEAHSTLRSASPYCTANVCCRWRFRPTIAMWPVEVSTRMSRYGICSQAKRVSSLGTVKPLPVWIFRVTECCSPRPVTTALSDCGESRTAARWRPWRATRAAFIKRRSLATITAWLRLCTDKTVRIWDVESGKERTTLRGHSDRVWALALSKDGKLLASGGDDRSIKIWDTVRGCCCGRFVVTPTSCYLWRFLRTARP